MSVQNVRAASHDSVLGFLSDGDRPRTRIDPRLALIDRLFERLFRLMSHWGVAPEVMCARMNAAALRIVGVHEGPKPLLKARTYEEVHASAEILRLWFQDPDFVDPTGYPRKLSMAGRDPSFADIVRRATEGVDVRTALQELRAAGAVAVDEEGNVSVESRLLACDGAARRAEVGLYAAENLLASVERNVKHPDAKDALQCETVSLTFDRAQLPRVARQLRRQSIGMLEQTDDWLHEHSGRRSRGKGNTATVTVGLYITIRATDESQDSMRGAANGAIAGPQRV